MEVELGKVLFNIRCNLRDAGRCLLARASEKLELRSAVLWCPQISELHIVLATRSRKGGRLLTSVVSSCVGETKSTEYGFRYVFLWTRLGSLQTSAKPTLPSATMAEQSSVKSIRSLLDVSLRVGRSSTQTLLPSLDALGS